MFGFTKASPPAPPTAKEFTFELRDTSQSPFNAFMASEKRLSELTVEELNRLLDDPACPLWLWGDVIQAWKAKKL